MRKNLTLRKLWLSLLLLVGASTVAFAQNVAKVGSTGYATIEEAIAAWGPGKTLTLLDNVTTTSTVIVEVNATKSTQNWTLDLGDYTWTASGCNAFQLYAAGGTVMNQNYGLKVYANENGGIKASGNYCIEAKYDNAKTRYRPRLEIHGGTYEGSYIIYYYSSSWSNSNIENGPSTHIFKSNDGTEPIFNGNFGMYKCPLTITAGYFNGTSFNTYPVGSTADTYLKGGHFKTLSAFPSASNNKGIIFGDYKVFVKSDASIDVINGAPATYEAKATKTLLLSSYQGVNYSDYVYYEKADDALNKYSSSTIEIVLSEGVTATQDKSFRSGTLTIDTSAEGSDYTGNIILTSTSAKFIIKYPEGKGHYGVTASTGQLHVVESVADGVVTRTYSVQNVSNPEAKVDNTSYSTVYDAFYSIDGTTDNKTIVLQRDVTNAGIVTNGTATGGDGKTVATFDLNGKSIGIGSVAAGNNADYTLTIIDSSEGKTGTVTNSDASLFILALTGINDYSGSYTLKIQAGTWQFDPSNVVINGETHNLVDEGYVSRDNGNGTWTVGKDYVAAIGETKYATLDDAAAAAKSGETILVLKDIDLSSHARSNSDDIVIEGVTLDLNGYTIRGYNSGVRYSGAGATIKNGTFDFVDAEAKPNYGLSIGSYNNETHSGNITLEDLTVKGGINIDYADVVLNNVNIDMGASTFYAIWVDEDGASAIYHSGAITASSSATAVFGVAKGLNGAADGSIQVTGGKILTNGKTFRLGGNNLPVEVSGGVFDVEIPEDCLAENYISTANTDEETKTNYPYTVKVGTYVAEIVGGAKYETLQAAVDAAEANATIKVLKDLTLTTVTTEPNNKYNVNVNKNVTIDGQGYTITSSEGKRAFAISGEGNDITLKNMRVVNNKADWCMGIVNNLTCTLDNTTLDASGFAGNYNQPLTIGSIEGSGRVTLNVINGSVIKTNDEGTAHYDIIAWHPADINVTNSTLIGWAGVYLKSDAAGSTVKIDGSQMISKGIAGESNNFAVIVTEGGNNDIEINNTNIRTTPAANTYQSLISMSGEGNCVKFLGSTTYETTDMKWGKVTYSPGSLFNNKVYFDDATKAAFTKYFTDAEGPTISDEMDANVNLYPLNYQPEVMYYWSNGNGGYDGVYTNFADPFEKTEEFILGDGEFIRLMKDITFDHNITNPLESGAINLTFGDFTITKGDFSLILKEGQSFNTDKQTDIFTAANPDMKVVETVNTEGVYAYTYTVAPKVYVAQIGETKYESLANAIAAVPANGSEATTITMIADDAVEAGVTIAAGQNIVLELNGKTISGNTDSSKSYALITNKGTLVIQDNTDTNLDGTGTGLITTYISNPDGGDVPGYASNTITNNGNLTVKSGKIVNNGNGYACYAIDTQTNGTSYSPVLKIEGGRMQQMNAYTYAVRIFANSTTNVNTCEVSGGVIEGGYGLWLQTPNDKANKADLKITGGTINANDGAALYIGGTKADNSNISIDIEGGQVNGTGVIIQGPISGTYGNVSITDGEFVNIQCGANVEHFISGGIFKEIINETYIAEGYIPTANTDPETMEAYPYTVKSGVYVAAIGDVKYETLEEAIEAATDGANTITLLADIDMGNASVNIDKAVTINGDGYTISSAAAQAFFITGSGDVTIANTKVTASNGHGIQTGDDNNAYSGKLTVSEGSVLTVAKRGINVWNAADDFALEVNGSTIQSNVEDPTTTFTTGNDARGINLIGSGYNVTLTNATVQGFAYNVNVPTSGTNLTVDITGGTYNGWSFINNWGSNNTFNVTGATAACTGLPTGDSNSFSAIIDNVGSTNNAYTLTDCTFSTAPQGETVREDFLDLRGTNAIVKVLGSTTYTTSNDALSNFIYSEVELFTNKLYFDDTTKDTFANAFEEAVIADEKDAEVNLYPVTFTPEVYYYWDNGNGGYEGVYCDFVAPFEDTANYILGDGEFIALQKNVTLDHNITNPLEEGTINLILGDFNITKGDYSVKLALGQSVNTDKQTDIFSTDVEDYKVVETATENGFVYSLAPKTYVAQIGDVKYESLADAVAAVPANGTETTITMIANEMINVTGYAITIPATKNIILDLNGYQVVGTVEQEGTSALIRNLGTLTIKDSSDTNKDGSGTGKLMSGASPTWTWDGSDDYSGSYASNLIRNEKNLIVESGYLYNMSTGSAAYAIDNYSAGNVTINGGKVDAAKASAIRMFYVNGGSITVTGGVIGRNLSDNDRCYMGIQVMGGTNVNVSVAGGSIAGQYAFYAGNTGGNITISDGTFNGYVSSANLSEFITGGLFTNKPHSSLIGKPGYTFGPYEADPTYYTLVPAEVDYSWIENGTTYHDYLLFVDPFKNDYLMDGEFITLLKNVTLTESVTCPFDEGAFTLTFGDYTVTKGSYSVSIKAGVKVYTDKQTNIFTSPDGKVVETVNEAGGFIYSVEAGVFELFDTDESYPYPDGAAANKVTYTRSFSSSQVGNYQSWFVPFDYTVTEEDEENFTFYKIHMIAASGNSQGGEVQNNELVYIYIEPVEAGTVLKGNRPYIVKPAKAMTNHVFVADNITKLYAVDTSSRLHQETTEFEYDFYCQYYKKTWVEPNQMLAMSSGKIAWNSGNNALGTYRWYIQTTAKDNGGYAKPMFEFVVPESNNGIATNLRSISSDDANIEGIYTINGVKVDHPAKGVNIVRYNDGSTKKIYIK